MAKAWLAFALCGCLGNEPLAAASDPYCPIGWKRDFSQKSQCSPPLGYDSIIWAELGGSGAYGFVRAGQAYNNCVEEHQYQHYDEPCPSPFLLDTDVHVLRMSDETEVATVKTNLAGVFRVRLDPDKYRMTGVDPTEELPFISGIATVVPQGVAMVDVEVASVTE